MNEIHVYFDGQISVQTDPLWQYDDEQVLIFEDIDLPEQYEVHFSNHRDTGRTIPQIGTAEGVRIPSKVLKNGKTIFAWLYLNSATRRLVTIPVRRRAGIGDVDETEEEQMTISVLIEQMQSTLEQVQEYASTITAQVDRMEQLLDQAEGLTATVDSDGYINIG